jgi:hypothetical protein
VGGLCMRGRIQRRDHLNVFNHEAGGSVLLRKLGVKLPACTVSKTSTNDRNGDRWAAHADMLNAYKLSQHFKNEDHLGH